MLKYFILSTVFAAEASIFDQSQNIMEANDGAFEAMMNQTIVNDATACYKYSMVLFWDGVDAIKYGFIDPPLAWTTVGLMIHKSPIVYFQCETIITDINYMDTIFKMFDDVTALEVYTHIFENLLWNSGDVLKNAIESRQNLANEEYELFGENVGHIVSDIFYVNPVDDAIWDEENSRIIKSDGTSEKVPSSFSGEMKVESSRKGLFKKSM